MKIDDIFSEEHCPDRHIKGRNQFFYRSYFDTDDERHSRPLQCEYVKNYLTSERWITKHVYTALMNIRRDPVNHTLGYNILAMGGRSVMMIDQGLDPLFYWVHAWERDPDDLYPDDIDKDTKERCLYLAHLLQPTTPMLSWFDL